MKVYSVDVQICATAYIKAKSKADAMRQAAALNGESPSILTTDKCMKRAFKPRDHEGRVAISGLQYDDPALPNVSLSPAMTIYGAWPGVEAERAD